jgi:acyl-CoA synthetase (AMP-forming)/AMP-acid ligase II
LQSWRFARLLELAPDDRVWGAFPFFWTAGFAMVMGATLAAGACLVLQEYFEPGEALRLLERERVTIAHAWPHQLAEMENHADWAKVDLASLRKIDATAAFARHPTVDVKEPWVPRPAYGLSETFTIVTSWDCGLLPGNQARIVDGEIRVKGPTLMKGYWKVPPTETFDANGFFATGDAGYIDAEGRLHWTGRLTELIKTAGANVSPIEIETALFEHPDLAAAAVVGIPDATFGEVVVLCAVPHPGHRVDEAAIRSYLLTRLASYKVPRHVVAVAESELVLTGSAKIRTEALRRLVLDRLANQSSPTALTPPTR